MDKQKNRRYPRIHSENILSIKQLSKIGSDEILTTSKIIGLGGLMFESEKRLRVGCNMEMSILAGTNLIKTVVQVVWTKKNDNRSYMIGVEFVQISEEDRTRILDYLMRRVYLDEEENRP